MSLFKQKQLNRDFLENHIYDVELIEEDTEIDSQAGKTLITAGNYVMTDSNGLKQGITPQDLENRYERR